MISISALALELLSFVYVCAEETALLITDIDNSEEG